MFEKLDSNARASRGQGQHLGRDDSGREQYEWVGRFATAKERDDAVNRRRWERETADARAKLAPGERITCREYAGQYLTRMESGALQTKGGRAYKSSSVGTARGQLKRFTAEFGDRTLASIERHEAVRWAECHERKQSVLQAVVTMFSLAMDEELIERNPFRGLMRKPKGRADEAPPTDAEFDRLCEACAVLGDHGPPDAVAADVRRGLRDASRRADGARLVRREPPRAAGDRVEAALPRHHRPPEVQQGPRDRPHAPGAGPLLSLPEREGPVFVSKAGGRLCAPLLSSYWREVQASAHLSFDFYLCTRHVCAHYMKVKLNLPNHVIAAQFGWSESAVEKMVATYAHTEIGALDAIDAAFAALPDANPIHAQDPAPR